MAVNEQLPTKLQWKDCCDHPSCERSYPSNLSVFYQGSGFDPAERELLDTAFEAFYEKFNALTRYRLIQDNQAVAWTEGSPKAAWDDIKHYALIYGQDGPVKIQKHTDGRWRTISRSLIQGD